jgi:hypothetical protein
VLTEAGEATLGLVLGDHAATLGRIDRLQPRPSPAACPGSRPSTASSRSLASSGSSAESLASGSVKNLDSSFRLRNKVHASEEGKERDVKGGRRVVLYLANDSRSDF